MRLYPGPQRWERTWGSHRERADMDVASEGLRTVHCWIRGPRRVRISKASIHGVWGHSPVLKEEPSALPGKIFPPGIPLEDLCVPD